jgi:nucleotide-binding universal stress UspA family protein
VVQLVHLAEQPLIYGELGLPIPITTEYPTHYAALLERLKGFYVPDHPVEASYLLLEGDAADEILRTADKEGCDLIVMGTHGRSGLDRLLAGSVAESVMRRAKCPVLTVRTPTTHAETLTQQQSPATS